MSREKQIFYEMLDLPTPEVRAHFLRSACGSDAALLQRVQGLLQAHEAAGNFLIGEVSPAPSPAEGLSNSSSPTLLPEEEGTVVGRYKLLQKIGEGGFGVVYMAEQREPVKRKVALKIIKLGMDTKQVVGRFEAERQALALMDHPNIAKVFDAGATETGRPYFVMELVRGIPLIQFCDDNQLGTNERLRLFVDVCAAIHHAHQKGIIHRDIKPSNVLITMHDDKAVPKVIDFGIAKATQQELTDKTIFTRYHEFIGTPAYMSPEQTQMSGLDIDTRSDIYSLGVLLYEMLTGRTPFGAKELLSSSYEEIRRRIREEEPLKPSTRLNTLAEEDRRQIAKQRKCDPQSLRRTLRGELDWIVMKALEKNRSRRYESVSALAQDVMRYLNDEPVTAVAPSLAYKFGKFAHRHKAALTTACVFAGLLLAGIVVTSWLAVRATQAERLSRSLLEQEQNARLQAERTLTQLREARQKEEALRQLADREADRARSEAATAAAVTRFLNEDLFAMADPANEPDREITLRTLLDRASGQLQTSLTNQPLVGAAIHSTIGKAYRSLSLYPQAEEHLRVAYESYAREAGELHQDTVSALIEYVWALIRNRKFLEAQPLAQKARAVVMERLGSQHPLAVKSTTQVAWIHYGLKETSVAFQRAEEAYAAARHSPDVDHGDLLNAMYLVARHRGAKVSGQFEAGEDVLKEALQLTREYRGENHLQTARAKYSLGAYYYDHQKKLDEAESLYLDTLYTHRRVLGETHATTLTTRDALGLLYGILNRPVDEQYQYFKILEFHPEDNRPLQWIPAALEQAPLSPVLSEEDGTGWRVSTNTPPGGWLSLNFDDSGWMRTLQPRSSEMWLRHALELPTVPGDSFIFKIQGWGDCQIFLNGIRAADHFGSAGGRFQVAVSSAAAMKALRRGSNVVAVQITNLRPLEALRIGVYHFPTPNFKTD